MDPVPDPLLLRKSGSAGDRTRDLCICSQKLWPLDHRGGQMDALISQIYYWNKTLCILDSSSVHHQEFFTVHTAVVYVIQVSWQLASRIRTELLTCSQAVNKPVWHIPLLCVQWKTPDDGQRNCLKHVESYSKNKFEKLVHLVGFSIRIYHDARSPERQIWQPEFTVSDKVAPTLSLVTNSLHWAVISFCFSPGFWCSGDVWSDARDEAM